MIAEIIIFNGPPQALSYHVPEDKRASVRAGIRVTVPLGKRKALGLAVKLSEGERAGLKDISELIDNRPIIDKTQLELLDWIVKYYHCTPREAATLFVPRPMSKTDNLKVYSRLEKKQELTEFELTESEAEILAYITSRREVKLTTVKAKFPRSKFYSILHDLENRELLSIGYSPPQTRSAEIAHFDESRMATQELMLNDDQNRAYKQINDSVQKSQFQPYLLFGVTGSGKSEIYLKLIWQALKQGKSALILLPEIVSAEEIFGRIQKRLGDLVCRIHSGLKPGERLAVWEQISQGRFRVVIGPRSALFAPIRNLGIIFVDEEHDSSYKQGGSQPYYHGRDLALIAGKLNSCPVVLGSATPSLESWYNVGQGKYQLLKLRSRWDSRALPQIQPVEFVFSATGSVLSEDLLARMRATLKAGGQIMLLLNRRGFAPTIKCADCGAAVKCPNCSVGLVYHQNSASARCHICDYETKSFNICPKCSGSSFMYYGVGTQKLEEEIRIAFPKVPYARVDLDSIGTPKAMNDIIGDFKTGKTRILIGTQMIAKAFNFPEVALMGILSADSYLDFPDFRSYEKTLALILQAAGRAGRGKFPGEVVIQHSENYAEFIRNLSEENIEEFLTAELENRRMLEYPPFKHLILLKVRAGSVSRGRQAVHALAELFKSQAGKYSKVFEILGPAEAPLFKVRNNYRWQFLVKTGAVFKSLEILDYFLNMKYLQDLLNDVRVSLDVDPVDML